MKKVVAVLSVIAIAFFAFANSPLEDLKFGTVYSRLEKISSENYKDANSLISILCDKNIEFSVKLSAINLCNLNFSSEKIADKYLSKINIKKNNLKSKATYEQLVLYSYILAKENPAAVTQALTYSNEACKKNKDSFAAALIASIITAQNYFNEGDKDSSWAVVNSVLQRPDWNFDMNMSAAVYFNLSVLSYKNQNDKALKNAQSWFKGIYGNKSYVEPVVNVLAQNGSVNQVQNSGKTNETSSANNSSKLPVLTMEEATEKEEKVTLTEGALPGKFSVSASKAVRFSKGNLIKDIKKNEFSFADEQVITFATGTYYSKNNILNNYTRYGSGYKDLSGSVRDEKAMSQLDDISGTNFDWGVFCKIKNGGNKAGLWRLLTDKEIYYLLFERKNWQNLVSVGYIDEEVALILLPDDWQSAPSGLTFTPWNPDITMSFANNYTYKQWQEMEKAGAVALMFDEYWLSSAYDYTSSSVTGNVFCAKAEPYIEKSPRPEYWYPRSVRLVQDAGIPVDPKTIKELPVPSKPSKKISIFPANNNVLCVYEGFYTEQRAQKIVFYKNGTFWRSAMEEYEFDPDEDAWLCPNENRKYDAVGTYTGNPLKDNKIILKYYDTDVGQEIIKRKSDGRLIDYIDVGNTNAVTIDCIYKDGDKKTGKLVYEDKVTALMPQKVTGTPGSMGAVRLFEGGSESELINPEGMTIATRFNTPFGFKRVEVEKGSYQEFLRNYRMYPSTHIGKYQSGYEMGATQVLEMDFIGKDIQECADVAMRLRCEYLFKTGQYSKISFHTSATNVFSYENYLKQNKLTSNEKSFRGYLEKLMSWAGSLSVDNYDTQTVKWKDVQIGDVIIIGGNPGHVVTIADMAVCDDPEVIAVILVQGFQPVQETEVVNENWTYIREMEPFTAGIDFTSENIKRYKIQ